jgi:hypothetical protein
MIFIDNKYTKLYFSIVTNAKSRTLHTETYIERHHIIPKSLGGSNSRDNLVNLTAREHFICHVLLTKMTNGQAYRKMIHAAIGMRRSRSYQHRYVNSKLYESIKKEFALLSSVRNTGKKMSIETKTKMSLASKGKKKSKEHASNISAGLKGKLKGPMSEEQKLRRSTKLKGKASPNLGNAGKYKHSNEAKQKIIESNKRRVVSAETKAKIAAGVKLAQEKRRQLFVLS